jgi:hypothetical protein
MRCTYLFSNRDKVKINNIKNSCVSHMLLKKKRHHFYRSGWRSPQVVVQSTETMPNKAVQIPPCADRSKKKKKIRLEEIASTQFREKLYP